MPHLILKGDVDLAEWADAFDTSAIRWQRAVLKVEDCWLRSDGAALLVEGIVVEFSRPLHPVAFVGLHHGNTIVRLWARSGVERTEAVQRWLGIVATQLCAASGLALHSTNIPDGILQDLGL